MVIPQEVNTVDDPFDTANMLPYLSPSSLFAEEENAVKRRMASNWGSYNDTTTHHDSLKQWQENDIDISQEPTTPVATTSRETLILPKPNVTNSLAGYVIPKLPKAGILSNKVNELEARVSPPARPILPKPPGMTNQNPRSLWNTSGLRPTQRYKEKK